MIELKCGNCRWWSAEDGDFRGMCHVFPPSVIEDPKKGKLTAVSPYTGRDRAGCWMWQYRNEVKNDGAGTR